ncbi:hypothetical protein LAZ67_9001013 [Cordylochernes scorpioides]|uniref:RNA-directed DNA polymerase n=1 Tax=Cordylochernes scorpioides TaxID=51811 RepID=A0ABY6KSS3_9ARAC|nr:hypothetical protein LAZ67_9001013 [Cordylochernes scorpioides]
MPGHRKRRQFKQTDAFTRGMVIGLKRAGWSIRQIAADTHLGASTVHRLWRRWLEQENVAIYRNVGATRVTSARLDRRILRQAVAAPQATCTAILQHVQDTLDHSISTVTISRRLVAHGLHSCRPLRRLPLTPPNRRQRLEWCRARSTWMTEWHRVVFSDESRFCLSSDSRRVRVWRRRGERSNPAAIVERPTVRQRGIMVWGAIAYDSRSPLLRIQGTMTAQRYVDDVLRPVTLPYLQGVPNALYQQDNARPHTARISQQALQDVQMLPWPPYSPDLSPIEHVWDIIGRRLHALPQPRSEDELWQMVEREWRAIPQDAIRTLIDSLPRRVAECIAVRDEEAGYTLKDLIREIVKEELRLIPNEQANSISSKSLEEKVSQRAEQSLSPIEKAPVVYSRKAFQNFRRDKQEMGGATKRRKTDQFRTEDNIPICFYCNRPGHVSKHCWERRRNYQEREPSIIKDSYYSRRRPGPIYMSDFITPQLDDFERSNSPRRNLPRSSSPYPGRGRSTTGRYQSRSPVRIPSRSPTERYRETRKHDLPSVARLYLASDDIIPPKSIKRVVARTPNVAGIKNCVIEGSRKLLLEKELFTPSSYVTIWHGRANIWVTNFSKNQIPIPSGMCLAQFIKIQPQEICPIVEANENYVSKGVESTYKMSKLEGSIENLTNIDNAERPVGMENISSCISPELPPSHKIELLELLERFSELFNQITKSPSELITKHKIATGDARPLKRRPYRVSPSERKVIHEEVDRMMEIGFVQPSKSPWASPVVLVRKRDGSVRFWAKIYSTMDLKSGYWQISVDEADREKTAFITPDGLFEFMVMPFGLCNAPATFERMMDGLLKGLRWTICLCYLDDVVVFADNFSDHLARIEAVLNCFKKVDQNGIWPDDEKIKAITEFPAPNNLQQIALTSKPVLGHFDDDAPTELHTDASGYGIGAVLAQKQGSGEKVIAYASRTLLRAEQNYSTTERECLAIIWAIGKFRPYLFGRHFRVVTDHHSLCWLTNLKDPADRLARSALRLQEYDVSIVYKTGRMHQDADCLSRNPLKHTEENFNDDIPTLFLLSNTGREQENDPCIAEIIRNISQPSLTKQDDKFKIVKGILYRKNYDPTGQSLLLVVPRYLRMEILSDLHDAPTAGHLGFAKTQDRVKRRFYWPGLYRSVKRKEKWIVVCTNYLTKYAVTQSLGSGEAQEIAKFLLEEVILKHGAPREIVMDRGRNFQSKLLQELTNKCGIKKNTTTAYHPQTNGLTDRLNRTIADMLSMYMDLDQKNWDEMLPFITFAYNTAKQESTGFTPFFLIHGWEAETTLDAIFPYSSSPEGEEFIQNLGTRAEEARQIARHHIFKAQETNKTNYDARHTGKIYEPEDLVWIFIPIRRVGFSEKLLRRYFGPFRVTKKISDVTYEVEAVSEQGRRQKKRDTVHFLRMKPYYDPSRQEDSSESECDKGRKRLREPGNPDLDKCVLKWFKQARDKKIPASSGWLDGFKERNKISFKTICGESGAVNLQVAEQWKNNLRELIQDKDARDVFNVDETGLFFKCTPDKTLAFKHEKCHGGKLSKERVTLLPMDKGVIKNLKHFYRRFLVENILTGDSEALKIKLDVLQASRLCKKAWDQVTSETIKHCFKKAGFVKKEEDEENADDIIAETMPSVDGWEDVISNPTISYDDFLNVDDDVAVCGEITDADIIAEVLNHNIEKQDGDEASGDEDESSVAGEMNVPSAAEATNYIMQLRRSFESKNDVNVRKSPSAILVISKLANSIQVDIIILQELPATFYWPTLGLQVFSDSNHRALYTKKSYSHPSVHSRHCQHLHQHLSGSESNYNLAILLVWLKAAIREAEQHSWLKFWENISTAAWSTIHRFISRGRSSPKGPPLFKHYNGSPFFPKETFLAVLDYRFPQETRPHPSNFKHPMIQDQADFELGIKQEPYIAVV